MNIIRMVNVMLLLDRKEGTSIIIVTDTGKEIKLTVVGQTQFGIKLGFEADKSIQIYREEIYEGKLNNT